MNHPPKPPPHPLELTAALVLVALELLRSVLVHAAALVLTLARWCPAPNAAGAAAGIDELAPDCIPAPRPVAKNNARRTRGTKRNRKGAPC